MAMRVGLGLAAAENEAAPTTIAVPTTASAVDPEKRASSRVTLPKDGRDDAILFGRCVDPAGEPLADVRVELSSRVATEARLQEYLRTVRRLPSHCACRGR